jgi:hypothetical protein
MDARPPKDLHRGRNQFTSGIRLVGCTSQTADTITWRFTASGSYTSRSAYAIQFAGSFADYEWDKIWNAKVENKCKLFCWLIL